VSDILKHIVVADSIGIGLHSSSKPIYNNISTAFFLGVASHAIMDIAEPDFTVNWFNPVQLRSASPFLGIQAGGIIFVLRVLFRETRNDRRAFLLRMAAIIGAVIPDIIDGIYAILNPHAWYSGQLLFPWHTRTWQINPMSMWATTFLSLCVLAGRFLILPLTLFKEREQT